MVFSSITAPPVGRVNVTPWGRAQLLDHDAAGGEIARATRALHDVVVDHRGLRFISDRNPGDHFGLRA
jgi:hypothetical protein